MSPCGSAKIRIFSAVQRRNMKAIVTTLCILAMLGYHLTVGLEAKRFSPASQLYIFRSCVAILYTPPILTIQEAKAICSDDNFFKNVEVKVMTDGPMPTLNVNYEVIKEIPQTAICGVEFLKKEGSEYQKMPLVFPPDNCCKLVFSNQMFKKAMEKQNVPKSCPVKQGKYSLSNYFIAEDALSDEADRGEYRSVFKVTLPSGDCLYGQDVGFKIADKK